MAGDGQAAEKKVRRLLAEADHERAIARWADGLRSSIRLNRPIKVSEMHQRRRGKYLYELDDRMPSDAVEGLYRALLLVKVAADDKAAALVAEISGPGDLT